jgi:hypothetical protein
MAHGLVFNIAGVDCMKDEALKLALEVLQWSKPHKDAVITHSEAMTAIKAALAAQPAHVISEKEQLKQWIATTNYYRAKREYEPDAAQPAQEPVAWLDEEEKIIYWHNTHETDDYHGFRRTTPLYTTPQQRPWVGLTDEDKETLILKHAPPLHPDYKDDSLHGLLQAANDFLKELNT